MKYVYVCVFVSFVSFGCWYGTTLENARHIRPEMVGVAFSSRLSADDHRHVEELMAAGAFHEIELFFLAYAARLAVKKDQFSQAFADDARLDAEKARQAGPRWRADQKELKAYREACGIPEPLPLPQYCR